ncbi:MAG TPA: hypothetical protein DER12_11705 [Lachnospiraceae bacterium]|nr:hypothetical protein [Lachnospiraceae bacterium]
MKIAFWSNVRGHSGVTSNLACISVLSALSCPNERTIVFENHKNIVNLGSTYYHPQSAGCVREPMYYHTASGLEKVLQLVEKGEELSEENLYGLTKDYLGKRLFYLPSEPVKSSDYLEYYLEREAVRTMECLERLSDMVMVDTSAAPLASSRKILQQADLVVVNLNQNLPLLSHFFRNYSSIQEKAFYLIGNYDGKSELTKSAIIKQFHIPGAKIGTIPHDTGFSDAMSRGQLIPFLLKNYMQENSLSHEMFMQAVKETVSLLQEQIRKHG